MHPKTRLDEKEVTRDDYFHGCGMPPTGWNFIRAKDFDREAFRKPGHVKIHLNK